ncbi:MAG: CoA-transferase subunit beta [Dehalococcoidia bacterium]|nr:CoA-transferase subunit beta [Dehalococcoidia bacterium]
MPERLSPEFVALLVTRDFKDGDVVNLGIGMPLYCALHPATDVEVVFHSEQGLLGFGPIMDEVPPGYRLQTAGGHFVEAKPGMCFMSHDESFALVRGGFIDYTVLGALEVDAAGNLANYIRPGMPIGSVGGGPDLAQCAKHTYVMMSHTANDGSPKIVEQCSLPVTAAGCVDRIFTDVAVIRVEPDGLVLEEHAPGWSFDDIQQITGARLTPAPGVREIALP